MPDQEFHLKVYAATTWNNDPASRASNSGSPITVARQRVSRRYQQRHRDRHACSVSLRIYNAYGPTIKGVSKKVAPPHKTFSNIFTSVKSFCTKFCRFIGNSYPICIIFSAAIPYITLSSCSRANARSLCISCFMRAVFCYNLLVHEHAHYWATFSWLPASIMHAHR